MISDSTSGILDYCQNKANGFCGRFNPGLVVKVELSDLPLDKIGLAFRTWELDVPFIIMLDKMYCMLCANRSYTEGLDDLILHELVHCHCIMFGNNSRHDCGFHGSQFAAECRRIGAII